MIRSTSSGHCPPDFVVEDIRAMSLEVNVAEKSPHDLFAAAIMAKPMICEISKKLDLPGVYKLMVPVRDLPKVEWY